MDIYDSQQEKWSRDATPPAVHRRSECLLSVVSESTDRLRPAAVVLRQHSGQTYLKIARLEAACLTPPLPGDPRLLARISVVSIVNYFLPGSITSRVQVHAQQEVARHSSGWLVGASEKYFTTAVSREMTTCTQEWHEMSRLCRKIVEHFTIPVATISGHLLLYHMSL